MEEKILEKLDKIEKLTILSAKNVLCFNDVAILTGLSKSHLYKLTCSHQIPHYKPNGKQIYFDRTEVENWMKQNKIATTAEIEYAATSYVTTGKMQKGGKA
jgi:excisionase family DNA binding protein